MSERRPLLPMDQTYTWTQNTFLEGLEIIEPEAHQVTSIHEESTADALSYPQGEERTQQLHDVLTALITS
jgi:hypothetical protein